MARRFNPQYNPIASVDGYAIPAPLCDWGLEDLSSDDSGRTEDGEMRKNRIGQITRLSLSWKYVTDSDVVGILKAFQPEYFTVNYYDPLRGEYVEDKFYRGDITAKQHSRKRGTWKTISFDIIRKSGDMIDV